MASAAPAPKLAYTIPEAVTATGLSRSTIYRLINGQQLRSVKIGGCRVIRTVDLDRLLKDSLI